ncbi:hypothetical protein MMC25_005760 [Agyrium rufum]|nr:hypothetical protein [Agyrium rufum]
MAAPAHKTINDLSGKWVMNKSLSDDPVPLLGIQGMPYLMRKAISLAPGGMTLTITQTPSPTNANDRTQTRLVTDQAAPGGIMKGNTDERILDWEYREKKVPMFGEIKTRTRFVGMQDLAGEQKEWLKEGGWLAEEEAGVWRGVQSEVVNEAKGWVAEQIWGFQEVNGQRYHVRRAEARKGKEIQRARLVYDYVP